VDVAQSQKIFSQPFISRVSGLNALYWAARGIEW
jgi:hypothetical protein